MDKWFPAVLSLIRNREWHRGGIVLLDDRDAGEQTCVAWPAGRNLPALWVRKPPLGRWCERNLGNHVTPLQVT